VGQTARAIEDYKQSIIANSQSRAYLPLRIIHEKNNSLNELISFYTKAISLRPDEERFWSERASLYTEIKQNENALKDLDKAISLKPLEADYYSQRALLYKGFKQYEKALKDYHMAIQLSTSSDEWITPWHLAYLHESRAEIYQLIKQTEKARYDLQEACNLDEFFCTEWYDFEREQENMRRAERRGKNWVVYSEVANASLFYDRTSIKRLPAKHVQVWIREEPDDVDAYIEELKKDRVFTSGYERYSHQVLLLEFDCPAARFTNLSAVYYDVSGKVIESYYATKPALWRPVVPDSVGDTLFKTICKEGKLKASGRRVTRSEK
jgi:tetratricopeptide (TPR) repeat protein